MHSSLSPHLHSEACVELIQLLQQCHQDHGMGKFFGKCNKLKFQLSKCFAEDSKERRRKNREKSFEQRKDFQKKYSEYLAQGES